MSTFAQMNLPPSLVQRLLQSGITVPTPIQQAAIPPSLEGDVDRAYRRLGMYHLRVQSRAGWSVLVLLASW